MFELLANPLGNRSNFCQSRNPINYRWTSDSANVVPLP
jgi:hypothetical protein